MVIRKGIPYVGYINKEAKTEYKKLNFKFSPNLFNVQNVDYAKSELKTEA